jgi:hypothetical protein
MKKKLKMFAIVLLGACSLTAAAQNNEILTISPNTLAPGSTGTTVTFNLDTDDPPPPPAGVAPDSVVIGTLNGASINHPDQYTITAVFDVPSDESGGARNATITFTTPQGTLTYTKTGGVTIEGDADLSSGLTLFAPLPETNTYLIDSSGSIVHTWSDTYGPGNAVYFETNGSLYKTCNTRDTWFNEGGAGGRVERRDWDGELLWAFDHSSTNGRLHHDIEVLPNGNILMIAWELKTQADCIAAGRNPSLLSDGELWPDTIIEVAPTGSYGGQIVWEWHVWDHLVQDYDAAKAHYGTIADHPERIDLNFVPQGDGTDWNHINSIDYNAEYDQIILSVRSFSEIWIIDHSTTTAEAAGQTGGTYGSGGDLLYRWGNPQAYGAGDSADQQLFVQHDAVWIDDDCPGAGNILVFNNGMGRSGGNYSSVDEIAPPVNPDGSYTLASAAYGPSAPTWSYTATPTTNFYAMNISGAQRLTNGNTLICSGPDGYLFEVTTNRETVWEYNAGESVFRATRFPTNYAGFNSSSNSTAVAQDDAADSAYDSGWTNQSNGGTGFNPWQLAVTGDGGHFTGSSTGNAGGSGGIDTGGRAWGLWSTNGVAEAIRSWDSALLDTSTLLALDFDNGHVSEGASVGLAIQNSAGDNLWEFLFSGGGTYYSINNAGGIASSSIPFTGDGLTIEFQLTGSDTYRARITTAADIAYSDSGTLISQADQTPARLRVWNYQAGGGSEYDVFINSLAIREGSLTSGSTSHGVVVDTGQTDCYGNENTISAPTPGTVFAGQDAQYTGHQPSYSVSADGLTVYDNNTGLTWTRSPDINNDGTINADDKLSQTNAVNYAATLNAASFGGYSDWRLPSIRELYSLMNFNGIDISGVEQPSTPFIDTNAFYFGYGDTNAGDRLIDAQWASTTIYVDTTMGGNQTMFGLNLADGRIKGYPLSGKSYYVYYCRGNTDYADHNYVDNGDGTVSDLSTGLQWQQSDSATGLSWSNALAYAENLKLGGYQDWRLPNAKELQSLVDYTRAPGITGTAAIDPVFYCSPITNEAGQADFPWYWTSTTHINSSPNPGGYAAYVCFGRALGYMNGSWQDVHGAGCQRSDPKGGSLSDWAYTPNGYYSDFAPQGDAIRLYNYVRCVRGSALPPATDTDSDGLSDWYEYDYTTNITAMSATADSDSDGMDNLNESRCGTSPIDASSIFAMDTATAETYGSLILTWQSAIGQTYRIQVSTNLMTDAFSRTLATGITATPPLNTYTVTNITAENAFYRAVAE